MGSIASRGAHPRPYGRRSARHPASDGEGCGPAPTPAHGCHATGRRPARIAPDPRRADARRTPRDPRAFVREVQPGDEPAVGRTESEVERGLGESCGAEDEPQPGFCWRLRTDPHVGERRFQRGLSSSRSPGDFRRQVVEGEQTAFPHEEVARGDQVLVIPPGRHVAPCARRCFDPQPADLTKVSEARREPMPDDTRDPRFTIRTMRRHVQSLRDAIRRKWRPVEGQRGAVTEELPGPHPLGELASAGRERLEVAPRGHPDAGIRDRQVTGIQPAGGDPGPLGVVDVERSVAQVLGKGTRSPHPGRMPRDDRRSVPDHIRGAESARATRWGEKVEVPVGPGMSTPYPARRGPHPRLIRPRSPRR